MPRKPRSKTTPARRTKARGNGKGSVFESRPGSGRWIAQRTHMDASNKRITQRVRCQTEAEAYAALAKLGTQGDNAPRPEPTLTLTQATARYITMRQQRAATRGRTIGDSTAAQYRRQLATYIAPTIGKRRVTQITRDGIDTWVDHIIADHGSATAALTLKLVQATLGHVYTAHPSEDPSVGVLAPKVRTRPGVALTDAEIAALTQHTRSHRLAALFHLAVRYGLRQSELIGLTWDALDTQAQTLRIYRQWRVIAGIGSMGPLKTHTERTIPLTPDTIAILAAHLQQWQGEAAAARADGRAWNPHGFIFPSSAPAGTALFAGCLRKTFHGIRRAAGLPATLCFHDLRHTAVTAMQRHGMTIRHAAAIAGHSSTAMTEKYSHATPAEVRASLTHAYAPESALRLTATTHTTPGAIGAPGAIPQQYAVQARGTAKVLGVNALSPYYSISLPRAPRTALIASRRSRAAARAASR